jgi:vitamin B12 transporter
VKTALAVISILCLSLLSNAQVKNDSLLTKLGCENVADSQKIVVIDSVSLSVRKRQERQELISATLLKSNPSQNFAELLQKQSGIFIRQRGAGVLSTPSYKGLGTQQTPILINGANMQSSMNGTMDLSLIDATHFGGLSLGQADVSSTGAQNMGDAISLSSLKNKKGIQLGLSASSQEEYSTNIKFVTGKKRWYYSVSGIATQSANVVDLSHYDMDTVQPNTDFKRASILQTIGYKWARSQWTNTLYLQGAERGIPPPFFQTNNSRQKDANAMMVNKYRHRSEKNWIYEANNQVWAEQIVFNNAQSDKITDSRVLNVNTTASASKYFRNSWYGKAGAALDVANYASEALEENAIWKRPRIFINAAKSFRHVRIEVNQNTIRYEGRYATSGGLKAQGDFAKRYRWSASTRRVFRLPVLNELYWYMPGAAIGNANLKPEEGYKIDAKLSHFGENLQLILNPHAGTFQNWIQWVGAGEIAPENVQNVIVYGAVMTANHEKKFKTFKLLTQANIHYVRATYDFENANDTRNGKQLIYTPEITGNLTLTLVHKNFGIYANAQAVGVNYETTDNSSSIDPYQLYELGGYYEWKNIRIGTVASNLLDTPYFTQPRTPLPGRIIKININYTLKFKK